MKEIKVLIDDEAFEDKARGEGRGVGGPRQGDGGADRCVCPECGYEMDHEKGIPCKETECPKCGAMMLGVDEDSEKARGQGQGVGGPRQSDTGTDTCICPKCGMEVPHERGTPCNKQKCPQCDVALIGKAEAETAGIQTGRTLTQQVATSLGSMIKTLGEFIEDFAESDIKQEKLNGLYLVKPHARKVKRGTKKAIVKPKKFSTKKPFYLLSEGKNHGIIHLGTPERIDLEEFNTRRDFHRITDNERQAWWGDDEKFWYYPIESFDAFDRAASVDIPATATTVLVPFSELEVPEEAEAEPEAEGEAKPEAEAKPEEEEAKPKKPKVPVPLKPPKKPLPKVPKPEPVPEEEEEEKPKKPPKKPPKVPVQPKPPKMPGLPFMKKMLGLADEFSDFRDSLATLVADKAGRRVRGEKVALLEKLAKEFDDFKGALGEFLKWATYKDEDPETETFLDWLEGSSGVKTFKASDGTPWLLTWTTNAFRDREGEIFTTKSIEDYVTRHENEDTKGEFQFWHIPATKFGDIRWQGTIGRFLVEAGPFDNTPTGTAFKEFFSKYPDGHPEVAPRGWGTSHKYEYKGGDREDGVYEWFEKRETTVLPADIAANPHNPAPVLLGELTKEDREMNERQERALRTIFGDNDEFVDHLKSMGEQRTAELESTVDFKAKGGFAAQLRALLSDVEDESVKKQLTDIAKTLADKYPYPVPSKSKAKKPEDEEDEEKQDEEEEEEKLTGMEKLAARIRMLAGKAGKAGSKLKALADAMEKAAQKQTDEEEKYPEPKKGKTGDEYEYPKPKKKELDEEVIAESIKALAEGMEEQLASITDSFKTLTEHLTGRMDSIEQTVAQVQRSDEEKVAEKAALTPAASLASFVGSVIGSKEARVHGNSTYAKDKGPEETEPNIKAVTGVPMLDGFISNADQEYLKRQQ